MKIFHRCLLATASTLITFQASAAVKIPAIFSDHMVLQQKSSARFWGWADPGETVTIQNSWSRSTIQTKADPAGKWETKISTPSAGGPFTVQINNIELKDVLIGEVWLCSGQSNMVFSLKGSENAKQEVLNAKFPAIRYFSVTRQYADHTFDDSPGATWQTTTPETAPSFSAVAYYFAKKLHQTLNTPIGIVYSAWGGTPAEAWTPAPVLKSDTVLARYIHRWRDICEKVGKDSSDYHVALASWEQKNPAQPQTLKSPARSQTLKKPQEPQTLYYFERPWREPGVLFNGMINPVIPFTIKGVLWYQGESNVNYADEYYLLLSKMIRSWRTRWEKMDLPFYVVQISAFGYSSLHNAATVREAEYEIAKKIPNTAVAVTADLGNMENIHYTRKKEVGDRLALIALARDYHEKNLVYKGPEFKTATTENGKVILSFEPSSAGLAVIPSPSPLKGFELGYPAPSGDSLLYLSANAKIQGDKIEVWNDQPPTSIEGQTAPVQVRYAWLLVGEANLFNTQGLPAFPFRARIDNKKQTRK